MKYLSVCSGIEAASVAWEPLGWQCAGVSEIEPFPRAVLEQRLGAVPVDFDTHRHSPQSNVLPLFGDFTKIEAHHVGPVDLLIGGTPCQSFSIAGKRLGLDDPRGNLTLEFLALARRVRPTWLVWENVPGVLSHDEGRTFGTFLGLMAECGFERWAYRVLDAQHVRTRGFGRAVPQRRRRVFVVGYSGTGPIHPRAVLFDRESLRGNPAPRRQAGERPAPTLAARTRGGGGLGTDFDCDGGLIPNVSPALKARDYKGPSSDGDGDGAPILPVAHALRGEGFDASEDGTGRGTPIVPVAIHSDAIGRDGISKTAGADAAGVVRKRNAGMGIADDGSMYSLTTGQPHAIAIQERAVCENPDAGPDGKGWRDDGAAYTLESRSTVQAVAFAENQCGECRLSEVDNLTAGGGKPGQGYPAICFSAKDHGGDATEECSPTLRAGGHSGSHANAGVMPAVAASWGVRRLTPTECARLQGFSDNWARIAWRGKPADQCPDGPQYKAYGNSMATNVIRWIGERIEAVEASQ